MAKERGSRALAGLEATSVDESVPIDEDVLQAARDCYVLIRAARTGMEIYKGDQKYPDPMMDLAMRKITESWNLARTPVNKVSWGLPRHQYLTEAITDLRRSMRLLDQTLILLP